MIVYRMLILQHFFFFPQESRTALDGIPSIQLMSEKQLEYVLKVSINSHLTIRDREGGT